MSLDPESFASDAELHETSTPGPAHGGSDGGDPDAPGLPELLPQHQALLDTSGIAPDVAATRGYCSVRRKVELETLGFDRRQCRMPALLIPLYNAAGEPAGYQARADRPRVGDRGRLVKYEIPRGAAMVIDVPPIARARVRDPQVPLFITEGVRKADAAVSRGLCCVALLGVWCWRGTNACGGRTALPDWELFALNGRRVYLAFDSDVSRKREVGAALARLRAFLASRGAQVAVILLPPGEDGAKVGLDDYLAAGHTPAELLALATDAAPDADPSDAPAREAVPAEHAYEETPEGIVWFRRTAEGSVAVRLANFHARIISDVTKDDGVERSAEFEIEATLGSRTERFILPAGEFGSLNWVPQRLGARAAISPGQSLRDHLRYAIQVLSSPEARTLFTHLGWRRWGSERSGGGWIYLHAGGAIGPAGAVAGVEVSLPRELCRYELPAPPDAATAREAVRRSLHTREIAPAEQSWPLLAAIVTAPLGELIPLDFTLWVHGGSGERKSTFVALLLNHFGLFPELRDLPASFLSTGNALEYVLFAAKDAVVVVDDYCPQSDVKTAAQQDATAARLLRGVGNHQGRNRLTRDGRLVGEKPPRSLPVVTSELPPPGTQSSEARTLEVEWRPASVELRRLTRAQREELPHYRLAMSAYLAWLAGRMERLRAELPRQYEDARARFAAGVAHGRVAESAAKLCAGITLYLRFAAETGAVTAPEAQALLQEAVRAIHACAERTGQRQAERRPTLIFRQILSTLLLQGWVYLADRSTGQAPTGDPARWGYQLHVVEGREEPFVRLRDGARKIGWVGEEQGHVYLLPAAAHQAVVRFAREADVRFPATQTALGDHLDREGLLVLKNRDHRKNRERRGYRVYAEGRVQEACWVLAIGWLAPDGGAEDDPPAAPDPLHPSEEELHTPDAAGGSRSGPTDAAARHEMAGAGPSLHTLHTLHTLETMPLVSERAHPEEEAPADGEPVRAAAEESGASLEQARAPIEGTLWESVKGVKSVKQTPAEADLVPVEAGEEGSRTSPRRDPRVKDVKEAALCRPTVITDPAGLAALQTALRGSNYLEIRDSSNSGRPAGNGWGLDLETTGLDPRRDRVRLLSLATEAGYWVVDCFRVDPRPLFPLLQAKPLVIHNAVFDLGFLAALGFEPGAVTDTLLLSQLLHAGAKESHTLAACVQRELGEELPKELQRSDWRGSLTEAQLAYAARDAQVLLPLERALARRLAAAGLERVAAIEGRCLPALLWLRQAGVPFDAGAWEAHAAEAEAEAAGLEAALNDAAPKPPGLDLGVGWHWDSPAIVRRVLREAGCDVRDTDDETLAALDHPLARLLRRYRAAKKRVTAYGRSWLVAAVPPVLGARCSVPGGNEAGRPATTEPSAERRAPSAASGASSRLYPQWRQIGAASGRMACREPNVQQLPRDGRWRACISAPPGRVLVKADYSQIELRIAACIAGDDRLLAAYRRSEDLHTRMAQRLTGREELSKADRQLAKAVNFGFLYGMGAEGFRLHARKEYGLTLTSEEAAAYREAFFHAYPGLARWHWQVRSARAQETRTLAGRRRLLAPDTPDTQRLNTPVQGTGADGLKQALALLWERRADCPGAVPVIACHDEIMVECDAEQAEAVATWLRQAMVEGMAPLIEPVPVVVEVSVGQSWAG